ncbi:MAG: LD-carboxypeptidase [Bacteroidetes bacterium]|jgi:muramoyltetrapeptide carboxypeptidase|nr:LD-carboxypeptidase [Bacteroidota bacterium]
MIKIPPYLKKGDTIGLVCPSGTLPAKKAATCIRTLEAWGYKVKIGKTLGTQHHYFAATDKERAADMQEMLDDKNVHAVLCGRGGYGMSRIIDLLDFKKFKKDPKWVIGFSDITLLHNHCTQVLKTASLHAPMAGAFNNGGANNEWVLSLKHALAGKKANYKAAPHAHNKLGTATGKLVGGNLTLVAHAVGSVSGLQTKNAILFLEDIGEYKYNIDRMMIQLKRSGMLTNLAGLIVGGFTQTKDSDPAFGASVYEIIENAVAAYNYPVCYDFPVSHDKENYALKHGANYTLQVTAKKVSLQEL